jgi:hypothetical protein
MRGSPRSKYFYQAFKFPKNKIMVQIRPLDIRVTSYIFNRTTKGFKKKNDLFKSRVYLHENIICVYNFELPSFDYDFTGSNADYLDEPGYYTGGGCVDIHYIAQISNEFTISNEELKEQFNRRLIVNNLFKNTSIYIEVYYRDTYRILFNVKMDFNSDQYLPSTSDLSLSEHYLFKILLECFNGSPIKETITDEMMDDIIADLIDDPDNSSIDEIWDDEF